jgi:hypothetical protein
MTLLRRSILQGTQNDGTIINIPVSQEGHLETSIHGPINPFGSVNVSQLTPIFQSDAIYGINTSLQKITTGSGGSVSASGSMLIVSSGNSVGGYGVLQSHERARYRAGQGMVGRFNALFSGSAADMVSTIGLGHAESGYFFGYNGTSFGILKSNGGLREIRTLTVGTKSSHAGNATVTLNSTAFSVPVTNGATSTTTAYEISNYNYPGWAAFQRGNTVVFLAGSSGIKSGTYSVAGTSVSGSFAATRPGVASNDTWILQSAWNGDKLLGSGTSGVLLDQSKMNTYQIDVLSIGDIVFKVLTSTADENNQTFTMVHTLKTSNIRVTPEVTNNSFPFTAACTSLGGSTDVKIHIGSYAAYIEGEKKLTGNRFTYFGSSTSVNDTTYVPIFTIRNDPEFAVKANQAVLNLISVSAAAKSTNPVTFYLIKNATLQGTPSFTRHSTVSPSYVDYSATGCTWSSNEQVFFAASLGGTDSANTFAFADEIKIEPDETITMAAKSIAGNSAYFLGSVNTREDK